MKYTNKFDKTSGLPIDTTEYTLAQIYQFLHQHDADIDENGKVIFGDRDDWEALVGYKPNPTRRLILYCLRIANRNPEPNRHEQLVQLCRKFKVRQPTYWPRFLRERYQYARTRDFFAIDYPDIIHEYYAYEDEMCGLSADPNATGKVFDAAPAGRAFLAAYKALVAKMKAEEAAQSRRRPGIVK